MKPAATQKTLRNKKKWDSVKLFLYVLPFILLVLVFSYYPLYGWVYAFFDYKPPRPFSWDDFVGLKWFASLVESDIKIQQIGQVLLNTFVMSGISLGTSWLPMLFAVFMNELRNVPFRKVVQTVTTLPNFISWVLVYSIAFSMFNSTGMMNTLLSNIGRYFRAHSLPQSVRPRRLAYAVAVAHVEKPRLVVDYVHRRDFRH